MENRLHLAALARCFLRCKVDQSDARPLPRHHQFARMLRLEVHARGIDPGRRIGHGVDRRHRDGLGRLRLSTAPGATAGCVGLASRLRRQGSGRPSGQQRQGPFTGLSQRDARHCGVGLGRRHCGRFGAAHRRHSRYGQFHPDLERGGSRRPNAIAARERGPFAPVTVKASGDTPEGLAGADHMRGGRRVLGLIKRRIGDRHDTPVCFLSVNNGRTPNEKESERRQKCHEHTMHRIDHPAEFDGSRRLRLVCSTHQRASQWKDYAPPPGALEGPRPAGNTAHEVPTAETPAMDARNAGRITGMVGLVTSAAAGSSRRRAPWIPR